MKPNAASTIKTPKKQHKNFSRITIKQEKNGIVFWRKYNDQLKLRINLHCQHKTIISMKEFKEPNNWSSSERQRSWKTEQKKGGKSMEGRGTWNQGGRSMMNKIKKYPFEQSKKRQELQSYRSRKIRDRHNVGLRERKCHHMSFFFSFSCFSSKEREREGERETKTGF